jgi:hypothetical protein
MTLTPERAAITFRVDGTIALGCKDAKVPEKTQMKEITCDNDSAVRRFPTIDDADFSATFTEDDNDAGQDKIRAAKVAHTLLQYVVIKGSRTHTLSAYVENISRPGGPADEQTMEVTFSVSGGCVTT